MTADLKILWLTENYPPQRGGMSVSCDRIVRSLRREKIEIDVAHFSPRHLRWKTEKKINGNQFSCPVRADISHTFNRFWSRIVFGETFLYVEGSSTDGKPFIS